MSFKHTARKTSRGGGKHPPPMRIRVKCNVLASFWFSHSRQKRRGRHHDNTSARGEDLTMDDRRVRQELERLLSNNFLPLLRNHSSPRKQQQQAESCSGRYSNYQEEWANVFRSFPSSSGGRGSGARPSPRPGTSILEDSLKGPSHGWTIGNKGTAKTDEAALFQL